MERDMRSMLSRVENGLLGKALPSHIIQCLNAPMIHGIAVVESVLALPGISTWLRVQKTMNKFQSPAENSKVKSMMLVNVSLIIPCTLIGYWSCSSPPIVVLPATLLPSVVPQPEGAVNKAMRTGIDSPTIGLPSHT